MSTISSSPSFNRADKQYESKPSGERADNARAPGVSREAALAQQLEEHLSGRLARIRQHLAPEANKPAPDAEGRGRVVDIQA